MAFVKHTCKVGAQNAVGYDVCYLNSSLMTNFDINFDHVLGKRQPYFLPTSAESLVVLGTVYFKRKASSLDRELRFLIARNVARSRHFWLDRSTIDRATCGAIGPHLARSSHRGSQSNMSDN